MGSIVVPTVLASTPEEYVEMSARALSLTNRVHIDITDGAFTDSQTISINQIQPSVDCQLDIHLMVQKPADYIDTAISLHPHLIIVHAEADTGTAVQEALLMCRTLGTAAGIALLPQTNPNSVTELIRKADHVLIFTGMLGHNGGAFDPEQLKKVELVRAINPTVEISVDGGVAADNAALIFLQGVDVLYVGSAIQDAEDPKQAYDFITYQSAGTEL